MKVNRIDLPGFGCLSDFSAVLSPGLNVIYGENEAGKSTLQAAISALLYGFYENERALKHETERHDRFRPWAGGLFRGSLEYELMDGDRYEVRRDFADDVATQLIDLTTGLDIAPQFGRGRHGNVPFARRHFGMSRGVFQSCAFISQGEIFEVTHGASPNQIGDAVAAMADSARRDVSAARAIERLDAAIARIGTDRARTAELPRARDHLARARAEIEFADEARKRAAGSARQLEEHRAHVKRLREKLAETQALALKAQTAGVRQRLDSVLVAEREATETAAEAARLAEYATFPSLLKDELMTLKGQWSALQKSIERLHEERDLARDAVSDEERLEYETICEGAGALTDEQIKALQTTAFEPTSRGVLATIGAAMQAIGRAAIRLAKRLLRQPVEAEGSPPPLTATTEEARVLLERHRRYLTLKPRVETAQRLATEVAGQEAAREAMERQLSILLASASIECTSIDEGLTSFEEQWRRHWEYRQAASAAEEARKRLEASLAGRTREEIEERLAGCEKALADLLAKRPELTALESDAALETLVQQRDGLRDELERAQIEEGSMDKEVRLMLDGQRPSAELEEEASRWEQEVARLEKARAALVMAKTQIEEAMVKVYRDFAPAVNTFLSEGIEHVTEGRYSRAHVDPATLRVSLLVPETGQVITDPPVSHGTRTMVYVLMRIGLAQHMSAIGEPVPLVLDDPFVDVDARRLPRMLDFLLQLSERMQVLFFTKEESIARWFEENANGEQNRIHQLTETKLIPSFL